MDDERKIPASRIGRFARLAAMGVRHGAGKLLDRPDTKSAEQIAEVLGTLRGVAAKFGQLASYVDGLVPEAHREAYEASLKALQARAPRSSPAAIRALVESELGAPIDKLFASWSNEPIASASIGQVHRATLHDGREVAVKAQHPQIARALESDLANVGMLESVASVLGGGRRLETKGMVDVIKKRFREELDYELEAVRLSFYGDLHGGDPTVRVPALVKSHSSKRVLTSEFVSGRSFDEACAASPEERRAWAATLWRFVQKSLVVGGQFNADPHPGNYIFHPEGGITFLDYGCVQEMGDVQWPHLLKMHSAALAGDEARFARVTKTMMKSKGGPIEALAVEFMRTTYAPLFDSPFRVTRRFAASMVDYAKRLGAAGVKASEEEFFTMPADMLFVNRLHFGFFSVLARLDVEVDYAAVERAFYPPSAAAEE